MSESTIVEFTEPETARLRTVSLEPPGAEDVLVETECSAMSVGTELTAFSGSFPKGSQWAEYVTYPFTPGYSAVGTVTEIGASVNDLAVGDRVATRIDHREAAVVEANDCVPVPESVASDAAAFFALGAIAMNGVRQGEVTWGESVCVFGAGVIGQLATRFCRVAGARPVLAVDLDADRLGHLPEDPEVSGVDPTETAPATALERATGRETAPAVIEATGNPAAIADEVRPLREQGRLVILSTPNGTTPFDFGEYCNQPSYRIIGAHEMSHAPSETPRNQWTHRRHYELFLELLAAGELSVADVITTRVDPADVPETYERLLAGNGDDLGVIIEW
jgi:2-desacetyl-2-hydroxyethyl bacteriochlorophyllide A dehydrogenase